MTTRKVSKKTKEFRQPNECGFDGEKGIQLVPPCEDFPLGLTHKLLRGKSPSQEILNRRNTFAWYSPEGRPPKLLFVNSDGEWYDLSFTPVDNPFS